MALPVTSEALQIHGDAGYTTDLLNERYGDARLAKLLEGTSEIRLRVVSRRSAGSAPSPRTRDTHA
jgi:alkylation response protein AidB-like acyl-CoA dehydrogenase